VYSAYSALKVTHVTAVVLAGAGFALRFGLSLSGRMPTHGWIRAAPHAVDSALLASALTLAWVGGFRPLEVPWLEAKLAGLVVYILAGTIALRRGRTANVRHAAFAVALASYLYIVSVAFTKNPLGPLAGGMA
jgi:uncharacterized membrane protein SirB2